MTKATIDPHGGTLIQRILSDKEKEEYFNRMDSLNSITISSWSLSDLELIATGAYSPLTGFLGQQDYANVIHNMHLANGLPWTIPITLPVDLKTAESINIGEEVILRGENDTVYGIIHVTEKYRYDKQVEAEKVYQTTDAEHPGVKRLFNQGEMYLAGPVYMLNRVVPSSYQDYHLDPIETRKMFNNLGWETVVGFQTRNPVHRAHEYLQKTALEIVDGLLLNPLIGETKEEDIPADIRMESYKVLLENYYPAERVRLVVFPAAMRYAGPREAVHHALVRKNYGCTHFIVGRDHAGVGNYYGTYDAQKIFNKFDLRQIGISLLFFENSFYCKKCLNMASEKTCPHDNKDRFILSGTKVREMLRTGQSLPPEITRPEVSEVLVKGLKKRAP